MNLIDIEINPQEAFIYLDRYVNDGSPSGFSEKYRTSANTDPFGSAKKFHLYTVDGSISDFEIYGIVPKKIPLNKNDFFIHPDMINHSDLHEFSIHEHSQFSVTPTSSCRTVEILSSDCSDYIKLHYDGIIGRVNRKLTYRKAINGVQLSYIIRDAISNGKLKSNLCLLNEPFAKIHINPTIKSKSDYWSFVWREKHPYGKYSEQIIYQIPLFSFWSNDRKHVSQEILFTGFVNKWKAKAKDILIQNILETLLEIYFELLLKLGFQNEMNAQNILIGFDKSWFPVSIIIRDLMGIEKDLTLMKKFDFQMNFDSDYKNIYEGMLGESDLYEKRHSFAFDFKFCQYIIKPILVLGCNAHLFSEHEIISHLKLLTMKYLGNLPENYLSKGVWYNHDKELLTDETKRLYRKQTNPLLR